MLRRKIAMCMIPAFGAVPLCVPSKNAPLFAPSNRSVCVIPFAFIMPKAVFSVGGIIGCWRFKKIADCASTRSWQANHWPHAAPPPESISKCAKAKIRPITPRCGQSSPTLEHRLLVCAPSAVALRCKTAERTADTMSAGRTGRNAYVPTQSQNEEMSVPSCVSNPPPKPLMIWDGECHFCRRWIERWREITEGEVEYAPFQEVAERFPEIPREQFQHSVVYIDKTGHVFVAAEAVYQSLRCRRSHTWMWC